jgi:hypothetical protein
MLGTASWFLSTSKQRLEVLNCGQYPRWLMWTLRSLGPVLLIVHQRFLSLPVWSRPRNSKFWSAFPIVLGVKLGSTYAVNTSCQWNSSEANKPPAGPAAWVRGPSHIQDSKIGWGPFWPNYILLTKGSIFDPCYEIGGLISRIIKGRVPDYRGVGVGTLIHATRIHVYLPQQQQQNIYKTSSLYKTHIVSRQKM